MDPVWVEYGGRTPRVASDAFVAPGAVLIGDVEMGPESGVWFGCVLRGDVCHIRIGARTHLQDGTIVHVDSAGLPTHVGDDVVVGHRCLLHACVVEDRAFVGMGATVMDRAIVETGAMVAAGAVVPPGVVVRHGELWGGVPARRLRALRRDEAEAWPAQVRRYVELARRYRSEAGGDASPSDS